MSVTRSAAARLATANRVVRIGKGAKVTNQNESMMIIFFKALTHYYGSDPTKPGIISSWIDERKTFYFSVLRYKEKWAQGKEIVVKIEHPDYVEGLISLAQEWILVVEEELLRQLHAGVKSNRETNKWLAELAGRVKEAQEGQENDESPLGHACDAIRTFHGRNKRVIRL